MMSDKEPKNGAKLGAKLDGHVAESMGAGAAPAGGKPATTRKEPPPERVGTTRTANDYEIELGRIEADPIQPRRDFDDDELMNLASSLKREGQIQNITVRWDAPAGKYRIVSGERRFRAAQIAGLETLRATVAEGLEAIDVARRQLVENLLRSDLKPIEQANAYKSLMDGNDWTAAALGRELNVSEATISRALALLELEPEVQAAVGDGSISASAGAELARINDPDLQKELAEKVKAEGMTRAETVAAVDEAKERDAEARPRAEGRRGGQRGKKGKTRKVKVEWSTKIEGGYVVTVTRKKGVDPAKLSEVLRVASLEAGSVSGAVEAVGAGA